MKNRAIVAALWRRFRHRQGSRHPVPPCRLWLFPNREMASFLLLRLAQARKEGQTEPSRNGLAAVGILSLSILVSACGLAAVPGGGWSAGLAHSFSGVAHVMAMVGVGRWGAQMGGPALLLLASLCAVLASPERAPSSAGKDERPSLTPPPADDRHAGFRIVDPPLRRRHQPPIPFSPAEGRTLYGSGPPS